MAQYSPFTLLVTRLLNVRSWSSQPTIRTRLLHNFYASVDWVEYGVRAIVSVRTYTLFIIKDNVAGKIAP